MPNALPLVHSRSRISEEQIPSSTHEEIATHQCTEQLKARLRIYVPQPQNLQYTGHKRQVQQPEYLVGSSNATSRHLDAYGTGKLPGSRNETARVRALVQHNNLFRAHIRMKGVTTAWALATKLQWPLRGFCLEVAHEVTCFLWKLKCYCYNHKSIELE